MTDEEDIIRDYQRVHPSETLWVCPDCGGALDPLGDPDRAEERSSKDWWDDPEKWADVPAMECVECGQRFRINFEVV